MQKVEGSSPFIRFDGRFVEKDGELTLVAPWGTGSEIPLVNRVQGSALDGSGGVKVRSSLVTLHRNNWLVVEQSVTEASHSSRRKREGAEKPRATQGRLGQRGPRG
jgi:hypothetical protein